MTSDEIKKDIAEACRVFQAAGYRLVSRRYYEKATGSHACGGCVLSAVAFVRGAIPPESAENNSDISTFAIRRYGWNGSELLDFLDGFDYHRDVPERPVMALGRAIRAAVLP